MTDRPAYLRVKNWESFQHYTDRRPPWIKYHIAALDDYELTQLEPLTRLVYKELLLLAAVTDNNIPNDSEWIAKKVSLEKSVIDAGVENLLFAGFLCGFKTKRSASKAQARRKHGAIPRQSQRQSHKTRAREKPKSKRDTTLAEVKKRIANGSLTDPVELDAILAEAGINGSTGKQLREKLR